MTVKTVPVRELYCHQLKQEVLTLRWTMNFAVSIKLRRSLTFSGIFLFFSFLFIVQPFLAFILLVIVGLIVGTKSSGFSYMIAFFGACYLGLVNVTKFPESDLLHYFEWYSSAQELSLPAYLAIYSREPIYWIFLHTIANLPFTSEQLFVFTSTVIAYFIFMFGVIRVSFRLCLNSRVVACLVVAMMFFAPLFSLSAHLMRQFLAASLVILFFSESLLVGRRHWWILFAAILVHYSAIIFLPLAMIKKIGRVSNGIGIFLYLSLLPVIYLVSKSAAFFFTDIPVISFVLNRVAAEEWVELGHLSFASILFVIAMVALSVSNMMALRREVNTALWGYRWQINIAVFILVVIVLAANMQDGTTEISTRFFFYLYFLIGLVLPMYVASHRKQMILIFLLLALLIPYFVYNSQFGAWQYASLIDLISLPTWELWSYRV